MTTPVRRRGRTLRQRLLGYITDAVSRLRTAWGILTAAQTRFLGRLARIRPGTRARARIRAAVQEFTQALAAFNRHAGAFADRWASVDLPLVYREGALTMLDNARRPGVRFSWTLRHQQQVTALSAQYYTDLIARIQEALRRARAFLRAAQDAARGTAVRFDVTQLRVDHPLSTVIYANNARHPVDAWASAAITWQAVTTANTASARTALDELGVDFVEIRDGASCGWTSHDDPDRANRTLRTVQDALAHPTAHPHCVAEGTQVEAVGAIQMGYRFRKSGRLVQISTAAGNQLTITPNHPVLTGRGWIAAGEIKEGDDVVVRASETGGPALTSYLDQVPAPVEEVFAALGKASASSRTVASAEDFHGDGPVDDGKVDVVGADGELWRVVDTAKGQEAPELNLQVADSKPQILATDGTLLQEVDRFDLSAPGFVSRFDVCRVVVPAPELDPPLLESVSEGRIGDPEFISDAASRLAVQIATDHVVEVRYVHRVGGSHVYDLSTSEHAYFANGILVHNCVRELLPRLDLIGRSDIESGATL